MASPEPGGAALPGAAITGGQGSDAPAAAEQRLSVQVCYATAEFEFLRSLQVAAGSTVEQAIMLSGLLDQVPGLDIGTAPVGIYGKKKALDTVLRERDRVEVYRPLLCDPKETRRRRAGTRSRRDELS
jgi:putative ubiquitin-RnfH superfamily antitoxin RatB of RatAB toxin-antitoxin module